MYRECRSLQLPILVDILLLSLFLLEEHFEAMLEELGQNGNDILL